MNSCSSCLAVPTQRFHAAPDCAIVNANVPPRATGDGALTGCNEIGLAFGEALAPDSDGFAKPTAVERRLEPGRGERWRCAGMALARCHAGHGGCDSQRCSDGEATEDQTLTGTISPNGIVRLRVGVSQITGRPGSCGWSLQFRSVA